jgi:hypothetical protein
LAMLVDRGASASQLWVNRWVHGRRVRVFGFLGQRRKQLDGSARRVYLRGWEWDGLEVSALRCLWARGSGACQGSFRIRQEWCQEQQCKGIIGPPEE